ncbi:hypothetical protein BJ742DRAFT_475969 [Cladochytrium replicatum]|nr:hypothetical protein BJ742DRAFT_475969 [Cladochytrium replicatum]
MQATIDDLIKTLPTYAVDEGAPIRPGGRSGTVTQRLVELVDRFLTQELVSDHPSNTNPIDELSAPLSKISVSNGRKRKRDDDSHDKSDEEVAFQERKSKRSVVLAESITEAATGVPRKSWREPRSDDRGTDDEYMDWTLAKACARGWSESVVLAMMRAKVIECCLCAAYAECENEIRTANQGESESIDRAENNKDSLSMSGMVGSAHGWAGVYWELALMNLRDLTNATAEADVNRTMYAEAIREASSLVALRYHTAFMVSSNNPEGPEKAKTRKATLSHHFRLLHGLLTKLVDGPICNMISAKHFGEEAAESVTPSLSSPTSEQPAPDSVAEDLTDDEGRQRGRALLDAGRVAAERSPRGRPRRRRGRGGSTSVSSKKATPPTITDMDGIFDGEDSQDEGNEIEEDTLVWILKSMLGIHVRLFQLKWENDPFEFVFCIDELRNTNDLEMFLSGEPLLTFLRKDSANISERKAAASAGGSSSALLGRSTVVSTSESTWGSRQRRTDSTQAPVENPRNESADDDSEDGTDLRSYRSSRTNSEMMIAPPDYT